MVWCSIRARTPLGTARSWVPGAWKARIAFSGIGAATAGMVEVVVMYANSGSEAVSLEVLVNQVPAGTMQLMPGGGAYVGAMVSVGLAAGENFVTLLGGGC